MSLEIFDSCVYLNKDAQMYEKEEVTQHPHSLAHTCTHACTPMKALGQAVARNDIKQGNNQAMQSVDRLLLNASLNLEPDLDQLNHILGVLGSPTQEDLMCIINDKVSLVCWSHLTRMTSGVSPLTRCAGLP